MTKPCVQPRPAAACSGEPAAREAGGLPDHMVAVRLSAMGDVALTTGVLHYWWRCAGVRFTVVTRTTFVPLFDHHPAVVRVIGLTPDDLHGARQTTMFRQLAAAHAGLPLVDLHGTLRTRRLALLWKGAVFHYPKYGLTRRLFLLTGGHFSRSRLLERNVPQRYAAALAHMVMAPLPAMTPKPGTLPAVSREEVRPRLFLSPEEKNWANAALSPLRSASPTGSPPLSPHRATAPSAGFVPAPPVVALHPFATHAAKTWPEACWIDLARRLTAEGIPFFWVGQGKRPDETQEKASSLSAPSDTPPRSSALDFTNRTTLRQLMALLDRADVLITGDSGPMHLATGVGTPVLALFGPTCEEWGFFPSGERDTVLQTSLPCRPCSLHGRAAPSCGHTCMTALTPATVMDALKTMLASAAG